MIAHLDGQVTEKLPSSIIVDVHGVGYEVIISAPDAETVNLGDRKKFAIMAKIYTVFLASPQKSCLRC